VDARALIDQLIPEARDDDVQAELERWIAQSPGKDRDEKLRWFHANRPSVIPRLMKGMTALRKVDGEQQRSKMRWRPALRYYIRFGDVPKEGHSHAYGWDSSAKAKVPVKKEKGISAYPAKWNDKAGRWQVDSPSEDCIIGFDELMCNVADQRASARPVYLLYGEELPDVGSDDEPMVKADGLKVVKRLSVSELMTHDGETYDIR
jgi:hypothetical protein